MNSAVEPLLLATQEYMEQRSRACTSTGAGIFHLTDYRILKIQSTFKCVLILIVYELIGQGQ